MIEPQFRPGLYIAFLTRTPGSERDRNSYLQGRLRWPFCLQVPRNTKWDPSWRKWVLRFSVSFQDEMTVVLDSRYMFKSVVTLLLNLPLICSFVVIRLLNPSLICSFHWPIFLLILYCIARYCYLCPMVLSTQYWYSALVHSSSIIAISTYWIGGTK